MRFTPQLNLSFSGHEFLLPRSTYACPIENEYNGNIHSNVEANADAIMSNIDDESHTCCEMITFYLHLHQRFPYGQIDLHQITCWYKMYVHAWSIQYKVTNGVDVHYFDSPIQHLRNRVSNSTSTTIEGILTQSVALVENEHILEVNATSPLERINFTTTHRNIEFGVENRLNRKTKGNKPKFQGRRVVAMGTSCYKDRKLRIALFTESINWSIVGHLIILHRLIDAGRADIVDPDPYEDDDFQSLHTVSKYMFKDASYDIFKIIVSYLLYPL